MVKKKTRTIIRAVWWVLVVVVLVLPFVVIPLSTPPWAGRLFCAALFWTVGGLWMLWIALDPTESLIPQGVKLSQPGRQRPRLYFEILSRVLFAILGICCLAGIARGFVRDCWNLVVRQDRPQVLDGTIETIQYNWRTAGLLRHVGVVSDSGERRRLTFCFGGPRVTQGARYRFTVAASSGMILTVEAPPPERKKEHP